VRIRKSQTSGVKKLQALSGSDGIGIVRFVQLACERLRTFYLAGVPQVGFVALQELWAGGCLDAVGGLFLAPLLGLQYPA